MTSLNTAVAASLASIATINTEIARLNAEAKTARADAMQPLLDALATSGEVSVIVVYGWTPGFNDGEPCEHSYEVKVNIEALAEDGLSDQADTYDIDLPEELIQGLKSYRSYDKGWKIDNAALAANIELCNKHGHVFAKPSDEVMNAINQVIVESIEEEQGTDYYVTFVLKNGKFERFEGEYECGY